MTNGAMSSKRLDEIRDNLQRIAQASDAADIQAVMAELVAALDYERGVCATQAAVIKSLRRTSDGQTR